jgi:hypothetical protein
MPIDERLLDAVLDLTKEVHDQGTKIDKQIALLIEANRLKEEEQDDRIAAIEKIATPLEPIVNFFKGSKTVLAVVISGVLVLGVSAFNIGIYALNEATGLNKLLVIEKKNEATLKRLCSYLKVACE